MNKDVLRFVDFLADNSPGAIIIAIDANYRVVHAHEKARKLESTIFKNMVGYSLLDVLYISQKFSTYVRHHHERYNGTGYPNGLDEEDIPLFSRIIALCDTFAAMTGKRCYRHWFNVSVALGEILTDCGLQFDRALAVQIVSFIKQNKGTTKEVLRNFFFVVFACLAFYKTLINEGGERNAG